MSDQELLDRIIKAYNCKLKDKDLEKDPDQDLKLHHKPDLLPPRKDKHKNRIKEKDEQKNKDNYEKYKDRYDY